MNPLAPMRFKREVVLGLSHPLRPRQGARGDWVESDMDRALRISGRRQPSQGKAADGDENERGESFGPNWRDQFRELVAKQKRRR